MSHNGRVRIRFTSNINMVVEGTVDELLKKCTEKFVKVTSLSDGMKEVFINTDLITVVEQV